jgi:M6 family metalloprotease-like protein
MRLHRLIAIRAPAMFSIAVALLVCAVDPVPGSASTMATGSACQFQLGFADLAARLGSDIVGTCLENEWYRPESNSEDQTTTTGAFRWQPDTNTLSFSNETTTWSMTGDQLTLSPSIAAPSLPAAPTTVPALAPSRTYYVQPASAALAKPGPTTTTLPSLKDARATVPTAQPQVAPVPQVESAASRSTQVRAAATQTGTTRDLHPVVPSTTLSGVLSLQWGDAQRGSHLPPTRRLQLVDDVGQRHTLQLDDAVAARAGGLLALDRSRVRVDGAPLGSFSATSSPTSPDFRVDSVTIVAPGSTARRLQALTTLPQAANDSAAAAQAVTGPFPSVTVLCRFPDITTTPHDPSWYGPLMGSGFPSVDHFWNQASFGFIALHPNTVVGWLTLPHPQSAYVNDVSQLDLLATDCTSLADSQVNYRQFAQINMAFNGDLGGASWGGADYLTLDGVTQFWGVTWLASWLDHASTAHEVGHSLGLPHSSGPYGFAYDSDWDVMSGGAGTCLAGDAVYGCHAVGTNSFAKDLLGWISASQRYAPASPSLRTIQLERLDEPSRPDFLMARIPLGTPNRYYTVEARRSVGYDVNIPGDAVVIHDVDLTRLEPAHVVDPDNNGNANDAGAMWTVGERFYDSTNAVEVAVLGSSDTGFRVRVGLGLPAHQVPACTPRPRVAVSATPSGGRLKVTVTPTDAGDLIESISFGNATNAVIDAETITGSTGNVTANFPTGSASVEFFLRRVAPGAVTAPFTTQTGCGGWDSFAGGGPDAF